MVEDRMPQTIQFGEWTVEFHLNRLRRHDVQRQLEPKAMDVLALLIRHAGKVVSPDEILSHVWQDRVVEENAVHQRISAIRKALDDDTKNPRYIENIPHRGYRTLASIEDLPSVSDSLTASARENLAANTPPFPAYEGSESYNFVCYSHLDREVVYPEIVRLRNHGINIWYDEGIAPGSEWTEELAKAINDCSCFLYFLTPNSANSENCRDELHYAKRRKKPILTLQTSPTQLPDGLELIIGSSQFLVKFNMTVEDYWKKLLHQLGHEVPARSSPDLPDDDREEELDPDVYERKKGRPGWQTSLVHTNSWILAGDGKWEYAWLTLIGVIPLLVAATIGVWPDRTIEQIPDALAGCTLPPHLHAMLGFGGRWNWLLYPIFLPLSLAILRYIFRRSLGYTSTSPLVVEPRYYPIRRRLLGLTDDWAGILLAISIASALTLIDQYDVILRLWYSPYTCPGGPMDWGWYAMAFEDVGQAGVVVLTVLTTFEQLMITVLACLTVVYIVKFNSTYMASIYLRGNSTSDTASYVLDFDDPDLRFGLRKLSSLFDLQLGACFVGGLMALSSRYMNTNLPEVENTVIATLCFLYSFESGCSPEAYSALLFQIDRNIIPDVAQMFIVGSWSVFFFFILWIANVKMLPLKHVRQRDGRLAYLKQLIPPDTKYDLMLRSNDSEQIGTVAAKFCQHDFWPTGDERAADALSVCVMVILLMLLPIVPSSPLQGLAFAIFIVISVVVARTYLSFQRHLLVRVDRSLVK